MKRFVSCDSKFETDFSIKVKVKFIESLTLIVISNACMPNIKSNVDIWMFSNNMKSPLRNVALYSGAWTYAVTAYIDKTLHYCVAYFPNWTKDWVRYLPFSLIT